MVLVDVDELVTVTVLVIVAVLGLVVVLVVAFADALLDVFAVGLALVPVPESGGDGAKVLEVERGWLDGVAGASASADAGLRRQNQNHGTKQ
jgi:hypothetical protein